MRISGRIPVSSVGVAKATRSSPRTAERSSDAGTVGPNLGIGQVRPQESQDGSSLLIGHVDIGGHTYTSCAPGGCGKIANRSAGPLLGGG